MSMYLLWIFFHCMLINGLIQADNTRNKRDSDYDSDSDLEELKYIEEQAKISNGLKEERSIDHAFAPIGESYDDFEDDEFYDEDIKREKSLFPVSGFPSMHNLPPQNNPRVGVFPNQFPQSGGVRTLPGLPINNGFSANSPFGGSMPNNGHMPMAGPMPSSGIMPPSGSMPMSGFMSPQRTLAPQMPVPPRSNIPRSNLFPSNSQPLPSNPSAFMAGSTNPTNSFGANPNSRFPSFQSPPPNNFPTNVPQMPSPQLSPQRSVFPSPATLPTSFPQQLVPQQKPPMPSLFQQPVPQQSFPPQNMAKPVVPFPQSQPPAAFPQVKPAPIQHPLPSPPPSPPAAAKPSFPLAANGMNPFQSFLPYFFLPFPFGK